MEKVKNSRVCEIMEEKEDILQTIKYNKLKGYGHIHRMSSAHLPKDITDWNMNRKQFLRFRICDIFS